MRPLRDIHLSSYRRGFANNERVNHQSALTPWIDPAGLGAFATPAKRMFAEHETRSEAL
jgi:hypothetical protein